MAKKPLPTIERLRQRLSYDAETGKFTWLAHSGDLTPNQQTWNKCWAGKPAFTYTSKSGYHSGNFDGKLLYAHRVAWAIVYGCWPEADIDHINGVRSDNRIINLRDVSRTENLKNKRAKPGTSTGHTGVTFYRRDQVYVAQARSGGKNHYLGRFKRLDDAIAARAEANIKFGFHPNHGRS
ncbi:HNH endonuclease signature motif containing protein [Paracoccus sp. SM22M-07]|uniref:HNH endonuclease signature motif containing protein n=1 Tax=Paracoccus sp. SM22M-07 TaxID=1520813 RepID=UPI000911F08A|nr:HNH endonuclease signature motif containing protein [Paracoccus sp. SM22M-07]OJH45189.1 hypothetical protein IE00_05890 [Paracoccus sp. SM22M-07]